jgi:phosphatidylinositol alpha-1,6-mannosyltransferase
LKRILLVASEFPPGPGGIGHHAWFLSNHLSIEEDIELDVICPKDFSTQDEVAAFDQEQSFRIYRWERKGFFTYAHRIFVLLRILIKHRYTHFWCSGKFPLWMIWIQKIVSPKSQTLCILHGSEVNLANKYLRLLTHHSIFKFQTIIAVSEFTKYLLPNWILEKHVSLKVIPNGLDISDLVLNGNVRLTGNPKLLTIGHVSPRKGQHRLIRALPEIAKKFPNVVYHIVGRPIDQKKLEMLAAQLGVAHHVVFHGKILNHSLLWDYYNEADIFVLLSENQPNGDVEGFGIVALEANAVGKPVLGAKFCGVESAIDHRKSGFLVDADKIEEIVDGITYCQGNYKTMENNCKDWAMSHSWDKVIIKFKEQL